MASRLGLVSRQGRAGVIRNRVTNHWIKWALLIGIIVSIVIGNASYEAGNISGALVGLQLLTGTTDPANPALEKLFMLMFIGLSIFVPMISGSYKHLERFLIVLVALMSLAFISAAIALKPTPTDLFLGLFVPSLPDASILTAIGLLGTTVVPYNIFLHANLVREKWFSEDDIGEARWDTIISIGIGGLISSAILISSTSMYGQTVLSGTDLANGLVPVIGDFAPIAIGLGILAAGITSAITAPLAAAYVLCNCLGWPARPENRKFRSVWISIMLVGLLFASLGYQPIEIIRIAQVANGIFLPIVTAILIWITAQSSIMGKFVNNRLQTTFGVVLFIFTLLISGRTLLSIAGVWQ
jgi:Mn2+/Fe2+ NRAMP family transporter